MSAVQTGKDGLRRASSGCVLVINVRSEEGEIEGCRHVEEAECRAMLVVIRHTIIDDCILRRLSDGSCDRLCKVLRVVRLMVTDPA